MEPVVLILLLVACVVALLLGVDIIRARRQPRAARSRVTGVGFYEHGDGRYDISVYRDDPRYGGETLTEYRAFTPSSARRVQGVIADGEVRYCEDGRGRVLRRFPRGGRGGGS